MSFALLAPAYTQDSSKSKRKTTKSQTKKSSSQPVSIPGLNKEERKLFLQSWVSEEVQFPSEIEAPKVEIPVQKAPVEPKKPEMSKPVGPSTPSPFWSFLTENSKVILVGLAILAFAIYRLRNIGVSAPSEHRGRIFSKFRDK